MTRPSQTLNKLTTLMARLRGPDGCPWDQEQQIEDLRGYLLEEAHEVAAAIDSEDWDEICGELGDLLFEIVFVAHLAQEESRFDIDDVVDRIEAKMISRHPHVFGSERLATSDAVHRAWERRKADDRKPHESILAGVPTSLPALLGAHRMTQKVAGVGFDWSSPEEILEKLEEELSELQQALDENETENRSESVKEEIGDVLFTVANLARKLGFDPEAALSSSNRKFRERFARMETKLAADSRSITETPLEKLEELWQAVKREQRNQNLDPTD